MSGVRCVVWDEWCEMTSVWDGWCETNGVRWRRWVVYDGETWVVRDQWWKMSVVRDKCVYEALCEMSERSSVRCVCMYAGRCVSMNVWWRVMVMWYATYDGRWVCLWMCDVMWCWWDDEMMRWWGDEEMMRWWWDDEMMRWWGDEVDDEMIG